MIHVLNDQLYDIHGVFIVLGGHQNKVRFK